MKNEERRMKNSVGTAGKVGDNEWGGGVERLARWRYYAWSVVILRYQGSDT